MANAEILWHDGAFRCELRRHTTPPHVCLSKFDESVLQVEISSTVEAHERASALRLLVMNNLAINRWVNA
jgi:hypothetical protein